MPFTQQQARAEADDPVNGERPVEAFANDLRRQLQLQTRGREVTFLYTDSPPCTTALTANDTVYVVGHGSKGVGALTNASETVLISAHEIRQHMDRLGLTEGVGKIKLFSCQSAEDNGPGTCSFLEHFRRTGQPANTELTGYKGSLRAGLISFSDGCLRKISKVGDAPGVRASTNAVHLPPRNRLQRQNSLQEY